MSILDQIDDAYRESRTYWGADDSTWDDALAVERLTGGGVMRVYNIIRRVIQDAPDATSTDIACEVAVELGLATVDEASDYAGREVVI